MVQVSIGITVADPQAFVNDTSSKAAMEVGVATSVGVPTSTVNAILTIGGRRIMARGRVLQGGIVNVDATVEVAYAAAAATLATTVAAIAPETMALCLNVAFTVAGVTADVTVTAITATALMVNSAPSDEADDDVAPLQMQETDDLPDDWDDSGAYCNGLSVVFEVVFMAWMLSWPQVSIYEWS